MFERILADRAELEQLLFATTAPDAALQAERNDPLILRALGLLRKISRWVKNYRHALPELQQVSSQQREQYQKVHGDLLTTAIKYTASPAYVIAKCAFLIICDSAVIPTVDTGLMELSTSGLQRNLVTKDPRLRSLAIRTITDLKPYVPSIAEHLQQTILQMSLRDPNAGVRRVCSGYIPKLIGPEEQDLLMEQLKMICVKERDTVSWLNATEALHRLGPQVTPWRSLLDSARCTHYLNGADSIVRHRLVSGLIIALRDEIKEQPVKKGKEPATKAKIEQKSLPWDITLPPRARKALLFRCINLALSMAQSGFVMACCQATDLAHTLLDMADRCILDEDSKVSQEASEKAIAAVQSVSIVTTHSLQLQINDNQDHYESAPVGDQHLVIAALRYCIGLGKRSAGLHGEYNQHGITALLRDDEECVMKCLGKEKLALAILALLSDAFAGLTDGMNNGTDHYVRHLIAFAELSTSAEVRTQALLHMAELVVGLEEQGQSLDAPAKQLDVILNSIHDNEVALALPALNILCATSVRRLNSHRNSKESLGVHDTARTLVCQRLYNPLCHLYRLRLFQVYGGTPGSQPLIQALLDQSGQAQMSNDKESMDDLQSIALTFAHALSPDASLPLLEQLFKATVESIALPRDIDEEGSTLLLNCIVMAMVVAISKTTKPVDDLLGRIGGMVASLESTAPEHLQSVMDLPITAQLRRLQSSMTHNENIENLRKSVLAMMVGHSA
eukprot:Clim_evm19s128 gene=Clim_evmTU19s128